MPTGKNDLKSTIHHRLQVDIETGIGLVSGQGSDPVIQLRWSDDGGHTWSNGHDMQIGKLGNYRKRAWCSRLGSSRDRIYQIRGSDPVKIAILGAELDLTKSVT